MTPTFLLGLALGALLATVAFFLWGWFLDWFYGRHM